VLLEQKEMLLGDFIRLQNKIRKMLDDNDLVTSSVRRASIIADREKEKKAVEEKEKENEKGKGKGKEKEGKGKEGEDDDVDSDIDAFIESMNINPELLGDDDGKLPGTPL